MIVWRYTIQTGNGMIITRDPVYAEKQSRRGYIVFCKRETNLFKYHQ